MTKRILRTVPAALLMTTAMAWNLPAAAQGTVGTPSTATGTMQKAPAPATPPPAGDAAPRGGAAFGGGLPADLTPAMPASAASAARQGQPAGTPATRTAPSKP